MKRSVASIALILAFLAMPAVALASGNATKSQYSQAVQSVKDKSATRSPSSSSPTTSPSAVKDSTTTRTASTGSLPFTGLDLGALGGGAVVLLGAGMILRRASADRR